MGTPSASAIWRRTAYSGESKGFILSPESTSGEECSLDAAIFGRTLPLMQVKVRQASS